MIIVGGNEKEFYDELAMTRAWEHFLLGELGDKYWELADKFFETDRYKLLKKSLQAHHLQGEDING